MKRAIVFVLLVVVGCTDTLPTCPTSCGAALCTKAGVCTCNGTQCQRASAK